MAERASWVVVAHLLRPQGRKGELLADLLTDSPDRFAPGTSFFVASPGFRGLASEARVFVVSSYWLPHGRNEGRIVLGFEGIRTIEDAEALRGLELLIPGAAVAELDGNAAYIHELVGCILYDGPVEVGTISDVQFMTTADGRRRLDEAAPLLVVSLNGEELLIPFVKAFLVSLDIERETGR